MPKLVRKALKNPVDSGESARPKPARRIQAAGHNEERRFHSVGSITDIQYVLKLSSGPENFKAGKHSEIAWLAYYTGFHVLFATHHWWLSNLNCTITNWITNCPTSVSGTALQISKRFLCSNQRKKITSLSCPYIRKKRKPGKNSRLWDHVFLYCVWHMSNRPLLFSCSVWMFEGLWLTVCSLSAY